MSFPNTRRRLARVLLVPLATAVVASVLVAVPVQSAQARPKLSVSILASGLSNPWDVTWVGDVMLFNERGGRVWSKRPGSVKRAVSAPLPDLYVNGEGGLMGMVADPAAASNGRFYVCYASALRRFRPGCPRRALAADQRHHGRPRRQQPGRRPRHPDHQWPAQRLPAPLRAGRQALRRHR